MPELGDLKPVYLIYGTEELLLDRAVARLRKRLESVADLDFNFDSFDGATVDAEEVVAAANTLPFMSERRLVVVRDVDRMSADDQAALADYASDPSPHACLVLVAKKVRKNSRLYRAAAASGGASEYAPPKKSEYPSRVVALFKEKGRTVGPDVAEMLVHAVGRDLRRISLEIDKVIAFCGETRVLDKEDLRSVLSSGGPTSIFDMLDALGTKDSSRALRLLDELLGEGESLLGIHAMSLRHVRQLLGTRVLLDRGSSPGEVANRLGIAEWQARNLSRQARHHSADELTMAIRLAAGAESEMKSGGDPRLAYERWVLGVTDSRGPACC